MFRLITCLATLLCLLGTGKVEADFTVGNFYATDNFSSIIAEYDSAGHHLGGIIYEPLGGDSLRGLAFGPDSLLYVTVSRSAHFEVVALDHAGSVEAMYTFPERIAGNACLGKIAFDQTGHFYVGGTSGVIRFDTGDVSSGENINDLDRMFDLEIMPNGHILAMTEDRLYELDSEGTKIRDIYNFTHGRGVEFDPQDNAIYASCLGDSGSGFSKVRKLDADSGQVLNINTYAQPDDLWLTNDDRLIVGCRSNSPGIFGTDLEYLGAFEWEDRRFVTQFQPVPEPSTFALLATGALGLLLHGWRRRR